MTNSTKSWDDIFTDAVHRFDGQRPTRLLEADLIEHFRRHPAEVEAAITKTADRFAKRKIHSPWPILLSELRHADERTRITATDTTERDTATHLAETWIANAGLYCPPNDSDPTQSSELIDELFGQRGHLHPWADDQNLRNQILARWQHEQPRANAARETMLTRARATAASYHAYREPNPPSSADEDIPW